MQPRIVKEITNSDTGAVTTIEPVEVRQVISKQTSEKVKSMMESVATLGTGKTISLTDYSVGGKTGTSEPPVNNKEAGYVASYVAISPIENTEVVLLLTLYKPQGSSHQGGTIAGPVVGQMLSEILPYLGVASDSTSSSSSSASSSSTITLPDVTNKTVTEAKKVLESAGFTASYSVNGDANSLLVTDQVPKPGTQLISGSVVKLYSEENTVRTSVTVPDLKGMSASQATNSLKSKNLNISIEGTGVVVSQDYAKNSTVEEGTVIKVTLAENVDEAH
jgi:stage V sporulation protein D (sporulation-specific penicillin-binding protein)